MYWKVLKSNENYKMSLTLNVLVLVVHWVWLIHFISHGFSTTLFSHHPEFLDWILWSFSNLISDICRSIVFSPDFREIFQRKPMNFYHCYYYYYYYDNYYIIAIVFIIVIIMIIIATTFFYHYWYFIIFIWIICSQHPL